MFNCNHRLQAPLKFVLHPYIYKFNIDRYEYISDNMLICNPPESMVLEVLGLPPDFGDTSSPSKARVQPLRPLRAQENRDVAGEVPSFQINTQVCLLYWGGEQHIASILGVQGGCRVLAT